MPASTYAISTAVRALTLALLFPRQALDPLLDRCAGPVHPDHHDRLPSLHVHELMPRADPEHLDAPKRLPRPSAVDQLTDEGPRLKSRPHYACFLSRHKNSGCSGGGTPALAYSSVPHTTRSLRREFVRFVRRVRT